MFAVACAATEVTVAAAAAQPPIAAAAAFDANVLSGFGIRASPIIYMQVGRRAAPSGTRARTDGRSAEGGRRLRAAADAPQQCIVKRCDLGAHARGPSVEGLCPLEDHMCSVWRVYTDTKRCVSERAVRHGNVCV
mmetsp:Transcript_30424/g.83380  ORF Transcript_30424/g.83380 Transcript_30424/m.83380 type:complete len:135 (-) Transcript_30424:23-427(-)